ncbi:MAG TPA: STAS domain-containing protein [Candidatus Acidoferrum sp.]|jgi:ABC-type transporter Mla MlaB component|nr:STAS domain-containing protein [Candidatus Acidoferrum sp.]
MPRPEGSALTFVIHGPIARSDLPGLYQRACGLLEGSDAAIAFCEVERVGADAVTVDALARLQLVARRHGCQVRLRGTSEPLRELLGFMGLDAVLPD